MNWKKYIRSISAAELLRLFVRRLWALLLAAVLVMGAMSLLYTFVIPPVYESTATLYILKQDGRDSSDEASQDFSLALSVVNDCTYLLKSHAVVDQVIEDLKLDISYRTMVQSISTENPENTRILEVKVTSDSPDQAKKIVDDLCKVGSANIAKAMGFQQVNIYEYGTTSSVPANHKGPAAYILAGLIAAVLMYSVFVISYIMDDRIRDNDDITQYLGITVFGEIPDASEGHRHHYGYYGKKYGYGNEKKQR